MIQSEHMASDNVATDKTNLCKYCKEYILKPKEICFECAKIELICKTVIAETTGNP